MENGRTETIASSEVMDGESRVCLEVEEFPKAARPSFASILSQPTPVPVEGRSEAHIPIVEREQTGTKSKYKTGQLANCTAAHIGNCPMGEIPPDNIALEPLLTTNGRHEFDDLGSRIGPSNRAHFGPEICASMATVKEECVASITPSLKSAATTVASTTAASGWNDLFSGVTQPPPSKPNSRSNTPYSSIIPSRPYSPSQGTYQPMDHRTLDENLGFEPVTLKTKALLTWKFPKPRGLRNYGNMCFLNSVSETMKYLD